MYLKSIKIINNGPIKKCVIRPRFDENGMPVPIIIIGENGTGKSILTSYLANSFVDFAKEGYASVKTDYPGSYRVIANKNIKTGEDYSFVCLEYEDELGTFWPIECTGDIKSNFSLIESEISEFNFDENTKNIINGIHNNKHFAYKFSQTNNIESSVNPSERKSNEKKFKEMSINIFSGNVICYFPPDRKENPSWISERSASVGNDRTIYNRTNYVGVLYNPIISETSEEENSLWIDSILNDNSLEIDMTPKSQFYEGIMNLANSAHSIKIMLQDILKEITKSEKLEIIKDSRKADKGFDVYFMRNGEEVILKNPSQLSNGEAVLFNMFATIIRYADQQHESTSPLDFDSIDGIVVIDEIDKHLDTDLQYNVLPSLIRMFPKIQFIITTHSPLFLLGMEEQKNKTGYDFDLLEMPYGTQTGVEKFSEFKKAYDVLEKTNTAKDNIQKLICEAVSKVNNKDPLIITEGKTDAYHLKRALNLFHENGQYLDVNFNVLDFRDKDTIGYSKLRTLKDFISIIPTNLLDIKYIIMCDHDIERGGKKSFIDEIPDTGYDHDGNVYYFKIPIPPHRVEQCNNNANLAKQICIEHYYTDDEIKTTITDKNIKKRLYMGNEFDASGTHLTDDLTTCECKKCGPDSIRILDEDAHVRTKNVPNQYSQNHHVIVSLSKNDFCNLVVDKPENHIGYQNFSAIFDIIKSIIEN